MVREKFFRKYMDSVRTGLLIKVTNGIAESKDFIKFFKLKLKEQPVNNL